MPFSSIDASSVLRALSQVAERADDLADVFFERQEEIELPVHVGAAGAHGAGPRRAGPRRAGPDAAKARREEGLAVRLVRDGRVWLAARDGIGSEQLAEALRRVARAMPRTSSTKTALPVDRWREPPEAPELVEASSTLVRRLRELEVPTPEIRLTLRRHRRWVKVIGNVLTSATESESFYSLRAEAAWGRVGSLMPRLDSANLESAGESIASLWRAREAEPPTTAARPCALPVVLGPGAAAVLLHEAVAHALEVDHLARGGDPRAALGVSFGSALLDVFDDPAGAPETVRRRADDEGFPTLRRCLLRAGVVEQPLADGAWARRFEELSAGAGRRGSRHQPPGPRCHHLVLVPREGSLDDLLADAEGGLYLPDASRGALDPVTGILTLCFDHGLRIREGRPAEPVGPCSIRGRVGSMLEAVRAVGGTSVAAGAGWCAKDGAKLPVWASAPPIRFDELEVTP